MRFLTCFSGRVNSRRLIGEWVGGKCRRISDHLRLLKSLLYKPNIHLIFFSFSVRNKWRIFGLHFPGGETVERDSLRASEKTTIPVCIANLHSFQSRWVDRFSSKQLQPTSCSFIHFIHLSTLHAFSWAFLQKCCTVMSLKFPNISNPTVQSLQSGSFWSQRVYLHSKRSINT